MLPKTISLAGERVLVTGAARGIGQATALALAELGAELVLSDILLCEETEAMVRAIGGAPVVLHCGDLSDDAVIEELLRLGPYSALAHVAGLISPPPSLAEPEAFDRIMRVNVRAPLMLATKCMHQMAEHGGGRIVIVGSAAGRHGGTMINQQSFGYAAYAASKGGVHTVVRWLARRAVQHNVLVNGVAPGPIRTVENAAVTFSPDVLPLGRPGRTDEIGWPVALLCSRAASFTSGAILDINGGSFVG